MSQAGMNNTSSGPINPTIPTSFVTNSGTAIPELDILNVLGGAGATTSGAGSTITITVDGTAPTYVNVTAAMSPYTVVADDYFISCDSTLGPITILFPNAPTTYDQFVVKDRKGTAAINNITITTVGGVVMIDGSVTQVFADPYDSLEMLFNAVGYEVF